MPPILNDIVQTLVAGASALEIVAHVGPEDDLVAAVKEFRADVVMTGVASSPPVSEALMLAQPGLRVLTLSADGRTGYLDRLAPQRMVLMDVSPDELIDALMGVGTFAEATSSIESGAGL